MNRQPVTVDGGNGGDTMSAGGFEGDPVAPTDGVISNGRFVGGPGNDQIGLTRAALAVTFDGGPGRDGAGGNSYGTATLNGGADGDRFSVSHQAGTLRMLGGDGPDEYRLDDIDSAPSARARGIRAGRGDDSIEPRLSREDET